MDYGRRLAEALELAGWARGQLAKELGVSAQAVGQVLTGATAAFTAANSARASRLLGVDSHWLATGEGVPRHPLMLERQALSAKAVYIGQLLDGIDDPQKREQAYAIIVQMLEFGGDPPHKRPPGAAPT